MKGERNSCSQILFYFQAKVEEIKSIATIDEIEDDDQDLMTASANYMDDDDEGGDWESQSDEDGSDDDEEGGESKTNKKRKTENEEDNVTGGELEGLKETAELYKSNIFKLEVKKYFQF